MRLSLSPSLSHTIFFSRSLSLSVSLRFDGPILCSPKVLCEPVLLHVPQVGFLLAVVTLLVGSGILCDQRYHAVEYFAGCKSWATGLTAAGYHVATFEILDDAVNQDILSAPGFVAAIQRILEVCLLILGRYEIRAGIRGRGCFHAIFVPPPRPSGPLCWGLAPCSHGWVCVRLPPKEWGPSSKHVWVDQTL